jgi:hypothetical protein
MSALFFDIDGTLLSEKTGRIPVSTIEGLRKAQEKGHKIFVNTGRTICDLPVQLKEIAFDGFCCGCGTYLAYQGQVLLAHAIPYERGLEIIDKMEECNVDGLLEGTEDIYFWRHAYRSEKMQRERRERALRGCGLGRIINERNFQYDKLFVHADEKGDTESFFRFLERDMELIDRRDGYYECIQKGYSKATAIEFFRKYLKLDLDHIYVFGDSSNDESMFAYAKHTIAMGHHDTMLDPLTEYVTDTVENDGVYQALEYYGLL